MITNFNLPLFQVLVHGNIPGKTLKLNSVSLISLSNETLFFSECVINIISSTILYQKNFVVEGILAVGYWLLILFSSNE